MEALVQFEFALRLTLFLLAFGALALWEILAPRRVLLVPKAKRWLANIGILVINTALTRIVAPAAAVGIAFYADQREIGLLHAVDLPVPVEIWLAAIALDLVIYLQHVMFHAVPLLWRLHRAHHADLDIDVTTGTRFHPVEMLMSMAIKAAAILVIGAPAVAVLVFEIALNASSMFNHSNVRIPQRLDSVLRWLVVTPDMHRVHHSIRGEETNRNFGFNLPWWDRLFGTFTPSQEGTAVVYGLAGFDRPELQTARALLALPFRRRSPSGEGALASS